MSGHEVGWQGPYVNLGGQYLLIARAIRTRLDGDTHRHKGGGSARVHALDRRPTRTQAVPAQRAALAGEWSEAATIPGFQQPVRASGGARSPGGPVSTRRLSRVKIVPRTSDALAIPPG